MRYIITAERKDGTFVNFTLEWSKKDAVELCAHWNRILSKCEVSDTKIKVLTFHVKRAS